MSPILKFAALIIDCADHTQMANFYREAVGAEITRTKENSSWMQGSTVLTIFRTVDGFEAPTWPSMDRPMQAHADYWVDDLEAAHARLEELGATTPDYQPERPNGLIVMLDPAGHPFCIAERSDTVAERSDTVAERSDTPRRRPQQDH